MVNSEQTNLDAMPTEEENKTWRDERDERTKDFKLNKKGEISRRPNRQDFPGTEKNHQWYGTRGSTDRDNRHQPTTGDWKDDLSSEVSDPTTDYDVPETNEPVPGAATQEADESFDWQRFNSEVDQGAKPVDETKGADAKDVLGVQNTRKFNFLDRLMRTNRAPKE